MQSGIGPYLQSALSQRGGQFSEPLPRFGESRNGMRILLQKIDDLGAAANACVQAGIAARGVGSELDEVLGIVIERERFPNLLDLRDVIRRRDPRRQPAERLANIDGRILAGGSQIARQNEM